MGGRELARYKHFMIPALGSRATRPHRRLAPALLALWPATAFAQSDGTTIQLGVGQQKTLTLRNVQRVAIGDPEIADVKQVGGGNELLLTGVGEGRTSLLVWQRSDRRLSYAVVVRKQDPRELVSEIRALLGDREGIRVRVVGDRVYLDGETLTGDDQERVVPLFDAQLLNLKLGVWHPLLDFQRVGERKFRHIAIVFFERYGVPRGSNIRARPKSQKAVKACTCFKFSVRLSFSRACFFFLVFLDVFHTEGLYAKFFKSVCKRSQVNSEPSSQPGITEDGFSF